MKKLWWFLGGGVLLVVLAVLVGPWVYGEFIAEDDAPAATVSTEGAQAATGSVDGQWTVIPGTDVNKTAAGYTVHEILNGAHVTVVGNSGEVSGAATVEGEKLTTGTVTVQVASIVTDQPRRDNQFRGNVMDTATHPTATIQATGTLTLKGQSRPETVDVEVLRSGESLIASGSIPVTWSDYGVQAPRLGFVTVDPAGTVDFLVNLERS